MRSRLLGGLKLIHLIYRKLNGKLSRLQLASQFTLLLLLIFIAGITLGGLTLSNVLQQRAIAQMSDRSEMMISMVNAVSNRTNNQIFPVISKVVDSGSDFPKTKSPETNLSTTELMNAAVPSLAAKEVFENLKTNWEYKDVVYKPATFNPKNLNDQPDLFEANLIQKFINDAPKGVLNRKLQKINGFRTISGKKLFYTAKPLIVTNPSCLQCHGTVENAPKSHVEKYGTQNGYGWKLNRVIGSQIIYTPANEVFVSSQRALFIFIFIFIVIFALVIVSMNYLLKWRVIEPLQPMSGLAEMITQDNITQENITQETIDNSIDINRFPSLEYSPESRKLTKIIQRKDELGKLAVCFQNMVDEIRDRQNQVRCREIQLAEQIQQLKVEIDSLEITKEVEDITQSEYFQRLQQTAKQIRDGY